MKKRSIIYSLFLSGSFFFCLVIQAQDQKKPSERSFTTEINKVKQIQSERNIKVRQMPQPTDSSTIVDNNKKAVEKDQTTNTAISNKQISMGTKPSGGSMKQPKKPAVTRQ